MELFAGALDLMILEILRRGRLHGYGIAKLIKLRSADALRVEEGLLYPALQRLLRQDLVQAEWRRSETGRKARYYSLTPAGKRKLIQEMTRYEQLVESIGRVLKPAAGGGGQ